MSNHFTAQEERFFAQVREVGKEYLREHPGTTPDEFDRLIPKFMRKVLDRQAELLDIIHDRAHNPIGKAIATGLANEVYREINFKV